jgi:hypothetical protein
MSLQTYLICPGFNDLDRPNRGGSHPDRQRSLAAEFPRRRVTLITTPVTAVGFLLIELAPMAVDEAPEMGRIQVVLACEDLPCLDDRVEIPGDGREVCQRDTVLRAHAIETTARISTIASDDMLG